MGPEVRPGPQQARRSIKKVFHCFHPSLAVLIWVASALWLVVSSMSHPLPQPQLFSGGGPNCVPSPAPAPAVQLVAILPRFPFLTSEQQPKALPPLLPASMASSHSLWWSGREFFFFLILHLGAVDRFCFGLPHLSRHGTGWLTAADTAQRSSSSNPRGCSHHHPLLSTGSHC